MSLLLEKPIHSFTELECEFRSLLTSCLKESAHGRPGLFLPLGTPCFADSLARWPDAARLRGLAQDLDLASRERGRPHELCAHFLRLCQHRGETSLTESRLAVALLALARVF